MHAMARVVILQDGVWFVMTADVRHFKSDLQKACEDPETH